MQEMRDCKDCAVIRKWRFDAKKVIACVCFFWVTFSLPVLTWMLFECNPSCWDLLFNRIVRGPGVLNAVLLYNFPPSDFYDNRFELPIRRGVQRIDFSFKYNTRYEIYIVGYKGKFREQYDLGVGVKVRDDAGRVFIDRTHRFSESTLSIDPCTGISYQRLSYAALYVPEHAPANVKLTAEITMKDGSDQFASAFPHAKIVCRVF